MSEALVASRLVATPNTQEAQVPCVVCRKRKVKCDKKLPCSNCTRLGFECSYDDPSRGLKRLVSEAEDTIELSGRMVRLESLVRDLSRQPESSTAPAKPTQSLDYPENAFPNAAKATQGARKGRRDNADPGKLVITPDSSRHIVSSFWAGLFNEVFGFGFLRQVFHAAADF